MNNPDINRLEELFKKYPAPSSRLVAPTGSGPMLGQIWTLEQVGAADPFREVVVMGKSIYDEEGPKTIEVSPLAHDATIAGPKDYILPEYLLCHHAVVLLSLNFSLPAEKLGSCLGHIGDALQQDLLAHYDKTQAGMLAADDQHTPEYFDQRDFRYRFHEVAARQITRLQAGLYRWLDELENNGEWIIPEVPVIQAAHWFTEVASDYGMAPYAMAAAGEEMPDRLESFCSAFKLDGQPVRLTIRRSAKHGNLALVVHGDRQGRCAILLTGAGKEIAAIVKGEARFEWTREIGNALIVADEHGQPLVTIKVQ